MAAIGDRETLPRSRPETERLYAPVLFSYQRRRNHPRASRELAFTGHPHFWAGERWRIWVTDKPNGAGPALLAVEVSGSLAA